ncbi:hypothetical protein FQA39_LY10704 [Lamprigera yunnana]|nr:hypothetical protein FQA39_LY10704 [Lamprigera yunnana]
MARLQELRVCDLIKELEERDLETSGVKLRLQERFRQWLVQNDQDPESLSFKTPEAKIMRKMQENSRTIKEGLMEKLEENSRPLKEMLEEKVNTINEKLEEKVNRVKDELIKNSRKTKEELNHRVDEVFQKCEELQKKYALLTTWDYTKEEGWFYTDEKLIAMWDEALRQCSKVLWENCINHTENLIKHCYEREKVLDVIVNELIIQVDQENDSNSDSSDTD